MYCGYFFVFNKSSLSANVRYESGNSVEVEVFQVFLTILS